MGNVLDRAGPGAATVVIPCYNEAERLDPGAFTELLDADPRAFLLFVDDGSLDDTRAVLEALAGRRPGRVSVLSLGRNAGKAEAVRRGLLAALDHPVELVGYIDADLATPVSEVMRLLDLLRRQHDVDVLMGSRVALLGRDIRRRAARHYLGRMFASAASLALGLRVYDTQCGAKFFRKTEALAAALQAPFRTRWIFDVELLGRLLTGGARGAPLAADRIVEEPLRAWRDVRGSRLTGGQMLAAARDLALVAVDLTLRGRR
jgi:glycosyltransferase involved in cell wall biosynthesis